jgi:hypothetical protein
MYNVDCRVCDILSMLLRRRDRIVYLVMFTALLPLTALIAGFLYFLESGRVQSHLDPS